MLCPSESIIFLVEPIRVLTRIFFPSNSNSPSEIQVLTQIFLSKLNFRVDLLSNTESSPLGKGEENFCHGCVESCFKCSLSRRISRTFCQFVIKYLLISKSLLRKRITSEYLQYYFPKGQSFREERFKIQNISIGQPKGMKNKSLIWPTKKIQCYCKVISD